MATYKKGDQEVLDYGIDWSEFLLNEGSTISTSTWIVPAGLTVISESSSGTATSLVVSGGTIGELYILVNEITTAASKTYERSIKVVIVENKFK